MFKRKKWFTNALVLLSIGTITSPLMAEDSWLPCEENRLYIGGFGGEVYSDSTKIKQTGTAFFIEAQGGPLAVDARGRARKKSAGFGGVQLGYEWTQGLNVGCSDWNISPAAEFEALFYSHTKKGLCINDSLRLPEHDFVNTFPMNVGIYLVNGVFSLNNCGLGNFTPYVGGGVGAAHIRIHKAKSLQISPPEIGINHFNSDRNDSAWTFAAQAKAGIRYNISTRWHIFAEYRFLYVDSSRYIFGSTSYPDHPVTSTWNIDVNSLSYNAFAIGVQFDL